MATIVTIIIGVTYLLGKPNDFLREVFCWLVAGEKTAPFFFPPKISEMRAGRWCTVEYAAKATFPLFFI
jgi:hypothetical protein